MRPKPPAVAFLLLLAAACTGGSAATVTPAPGGSLFLPSPSATRPSSSVAPSASGPAGTPLVLPVIATTSGPLADADQSYLDGMRLAVEQVDAAGGVFGRPLALDVHDDAGDPDHATELVGDALDRKPPAVLFVGPGPVLSPLRTRFEQAGTPVVLLSGDLYTSRKLFPQVFQTTIPWEWQANVIARYVVRDRKARDIVFIGTGSEAPAASGALRTALTYWGGRLAASFTDQDRDPRTGFTKAFERAAKADWAVVFGGLIDSLGLVDAVEEAAGITVTGRVRPRPGISGPASLLVSGGGLARPEPGTTACYTYTWAGWAQPIPRVGSFRTALAAMTGRGVGGLEQEGYDAIQVLAWGLSRDASRGGPQLTATLELLKDQTYSSFPIDFGPDDHLFLPRDELGLFAVAGRQERVDPWQIPGAEPWRAVMRTFTSDGQRTNVLDVDRTVFFPFWDKYQPGPNYWRSIYGIASRPGRDRLH